MRIHALQPCIVIMSSANLRLLGFLTVDNEMQVLGMSSSSATLLDVVLEVYLGGHEDYSLVIHLPGRLEGKI